MSVANVRTEIGTALSTLGIGQQLSLETFETTRYLAERIDDELQNAG